MEANDGLISMADLAEYQPVIREPIRGNYRGYEIYSMPPPSSGGIHLVQLLNILEAFPLEELGQNTAQTIHLMTESMKLAYADRSKYLGDTDFVSVPISGLISKSYAEQLRHKINLDQATPSQEIAPGNPNPFIESNNTTRIARGYPFNEVRGRGIAENARGQSPKYFQSISFYFYPMWWYSLAM
ncbi:MAG: gamma-glutamyltransferase, partial [Coleofasciculus chthonoplastes F3-SA18-01]|uniref:gamma-glutamyltransferase n=1 Tax=Coleofasciculus chthonoplastes TaxID=64178 RepID=UPI0032F7555A